MKEGQIVECKFGYPELDETICGGIPAGKLTLIRGTHVAPMHKLANNLVTGVVENKAKAAWIGTGFDGDSPEDVAVVLSESAENVFATATFAIETGQVGLVVITAGFDTPDENLENETAKHISERLGQLCRDALENDVAVVMVQVLGCKDAPWAKAAAFHASLVLDVEDTPSEGNAVISVSKAWCGAVPENAVSIAL